MKHELEKFRDEMHAVFGETEKLLEGLDDQQAATKPAADRWSIVECLDHLTITAQAFRPAMERALAAGTPRGSESYRPGWLWSKFVGSMEPPVRRGYPTSAPFVPKLARGIGPVRQDFTAAHHWVLDRLDGFEPLDLGKIKVESPFAKWVRYPLGLVFYILPAHCRRHVWQANRVKEIVVPGLRT